MLRREKQRLARGWTYEPPTFYEANHADGPPAAMRVEGVVARRATRQGGPISGTSQAADKQGRENRDSHLFAAHRNW